MLRGRDGSDGVVRAGRYVGTGLPIRKQAWATAERVPASQRLTAGVMPDVCFRDFRTMVVGPKPDLWCDPLPELALAAASDIDGTGNAKAPAGGPGLLGRT